MTNYCLSSEIDNSFEYGMSERNDSREDVSVFREKDTLSAGLRAQIESLYDIIDHDLEEYFSRGVC